MTQVRTKSGRKHYIEGSIVPKFMIFTDVEAEVNIKYLGTIDPNINRNESQ